MVVAEDRDDLVTEAYIHAGRAVTIAHVLLDERGHGARHQPRAGLDHHHLGAECDGVRRNFKADEATADHDQALAPAEAGAERLRIRDLAHIGHAGEIGSGDRKPPGRGAGRQQEPLVRNDRPVGKDDFARSPPDLARGGLRKVLYVMLAVRVFVVEREVREASSPRSAFPWKGAGAHRGHAPRSRSG